MKSFRSTSKNLASLPIAVALAVLGTLLVITNPAHADGLEEHLVTANVLPDTPIEEFDPLPVVITNPVHADEFEEHLVTTYVVPDNPIEEPRCLLAACFWEYCEENPLTRICICTHATCPPDYIGVEETDPLSEYLKEIKGIPPYLDLFKPEGNGYGTGDAWQIPANSLQDGMNPSLENLGQSSGFIT